MRRNPVSEERDFLPGSVCPGAGAMSGIRRETVLKRAIPPSAALGLKHRQRKRRSIFGNT